MNHKHHRPSRRPPEAYPTAARFLRDSVGDAIDKKIERAFLVSVLMPHMRIDFREPLAELQALAESAGVQVVDSLVQKRMKMHPGTALGKGRLHELAERAEAMLADVIIFDNDLSPRQIRKIEEVVKRKVIDRSELILDIFAARARSHEAKLQVELAQLQYTAPRLRGLWTHLERIAGSGGGGGAGAIGGVGTRGPGETQIEIDRRIVKDRIAHLRREIDDVHARRQREVQARTDQFTVSLVGYTNAGKTTLLNRLTNAGQFAADMLFATLDTKTVRWTLEHGQQVLLSDTVGFIRDLPHHLVASFRATLEEATHANLLLHVVDASHRWALHQVITVNEVLHDLGCDDIPRITLLNKMDAVTDNAIPRMILEREKNALLVSAVSGQGLDILQRRVSTLARGNATEATLYIPHTANRAIGDIEHLATVWERRYTEEGTELDICIPKDQVDRLQNHYPSIRWEERTPAVESFPPITWQDLPADMLPLEDFQHDMDDLDDPDDGFDADDDHDDDRDGLDADAVDEGDE